MEAVLAALTRAQSRLESAGIQSAVIGGLAVSIWGNPRLTQDVDFKVLLTRRRPGRSWKSSSRWALRVRSRRSCCVTASCS